MPKLSIDDEFEEESTLEPDALDCPTVNLDELEARERYEEESELEEQYQGLAKNRSFLDEYPEDEEDPYGESLDGDIEE